jgi:hypothetical protein
MARGIDLGPRSRVDPAGRFRTRRPRSGVQVSPMRAIYERPCGPSRGSHRRTRRRTMR